MMLANLSNSFTILSLFPFSPLCFVCYDYPEEPAMFINFTAKYTKIPSGYLGQLIEWPEVVTEGQDLEDCRALLRDALNEMILAYRQQGQEIPLGNALIEQLPVDLADVRQTA
jgi:predicted RNase H-like HicB family nuclease